MLRAAPDPVQAMHYLKGLVDESVASTDLPVFFSLLHLCLNRVDVSSFAAMVGAWSKGHKGLNYLK